MKPDWDQLMGEYAESKTALIADVDCTAGGQTLCEKIGVTGYPTIKFGDPSDLQDYKGERTLAALQSFASENLGPQCDLNNLELCDDVDKKFIEKFKKWDMDELDIGIDEKKQKIASLEKSHTKVIEGVEKQIRQLREKIDTENMKKEAAVADEKKNSGYKFMTEVRALRFPEADKDYDPDFDEPQAGKEEF